MRSRTIWIALILCLVCCFQAFAGAKIRFGALPVLQALPLFVAEERGLFKEAGLDVEIVPFNGAAEKDIAISTGNIDGYFGDLLTPIVIKANGQDVFIVATTYDTRTDRRMFGILVKPGSNIKSLKDLAGVPVAASSNSVVHYVADRLLTDAGVPENKVEILESKNIGLRMQLLMSGQVEAASLPEPLVTAAVAKGAGLLGDDSGLDTSQTVLMFTGKFIKDHPEEVRQFLKVNQKAAELIRQNPDEARSVMVKHVRLPEQLQATYPVPKFDNPKAPEKSSVETIIKWLREKNVIQADLKYEQVVNADLLK